MSPFGRGSRGPRSEQEREAARLERERRRAQREGRPAQDAPAEEPAQADPAPAPEPVGDPEPEPVAEVPPEPEPEPIEPEPDPEPVPPGPSQAPAPAAVGGGSADAVSQPTEPFDAVPSARRTVQLPRPQNPEDWERPIGTTRISRAEYQAQPGASGMPPHRKIGVPRRRGRFARRVVPLLVLLAFAAVGVFAFLLFQPFHGAGSGAVVVRIPTGSGAKEIGDQLANRGVVSSGFFFSLRARLRGDRDKLRAGAYTLRRDMSYAAALDALTRAPKAAAVMNVTLPEGPGRRELAPRVKAAGVRGSYLAASRRSAVLNPRSFGAPRGTRSLEGFLFPSTYELRRSDATSRRLVSDQLRTFRRRFSTLDLRRARRRNLSRYDVLVIASMIEREALVPRDRRLISAVIYNRLSKNIPLGIDATLRYRLDNWTRPLRKSELARRTAFNTRTSTGLPPTPIGNPGLAAMQAAANPAKVGYLYYVVKVCGNGAHAFSSTYAGFRRDADAYARARAKRGGKDPSRC